jgi:hypothetical protein
LKKEDGKKCGENEKEEEKKKKKKKIKSLSLSPHLYTKMGAQHPR